jgi:heat shock protein HslJ
MITRQELKAKLCLFFGHGRLSSLKSLPGINNKKEINMNKKVNWWMVILLLLGTLALTACGNSALNQGQTEDTTFPGIVTDNSSAASNGNFQTLYVAPALADCPDDSGQQCLQVKDSPEGDYIILTEPIEGFTFQEGYEYQVQVIVEEAANPQSVDSATTYSLNSVVSQTSAPGAGDGSSSPGGSATGSDSPGSSPGATTSGSATGSAAPGSSTGSSAPGASGSVDAPSDNQPGSQPGSQPGGGTVDSPGGNVTLTHMLWQLQSYNNVTTIAGTQPTAVFGTDGTLSGNAGCNSYSTTYTTNGNAISINGAIASTMMACLDNAIMQQEAAFLAALPTATAWSISGNNLTLSNASGGVVAVFTAVNATPLMGTLWQLTGYATDPDTAVSNVTMVQGTAVFGTDGILSGNGGCNTYSTSYTVNGRNITINPAIATTKMACDEVSNQQENEYLSLLPTAVTFTIQGDVLELQNAIGALVASYRAASTGTTQNN